METGGTEKPWGSSPTLCTLAVNEQRHRKSSTSCPVDDFQQRQTRGSVPRSPHDALRTYIVCPEGEELGYRVRGKSEDRSVFYPLARTSRDRSCSVVIKLKQCHSKMLMLND